MTDGYYISKNEEEQGPLTLEEALQMGLELDTMVLSPQADDWERAADLPEFFHYFEAKGFYFPTEDNLASFWKRLLAYILDSILISVAISIFASAYLVQILTEIEKKTDTTEGTILRFKFNLVLFGISVIYNTIFEATAMRGSIGKKLCKIVVVDADGRRLSILKALLRNSTKLLSSIAIGLGYIVILWDDRRQGWHDKIAKTYVVTRDQ